MVKGTNVFSSVFSGLPCLLQVYTRFHLSDYRIFWNNERWKSFLINIFASNNWQRQEHLPKWCRRSVKYRWSLFDQKLNILFCSNYSIMFKFSLLMALTLILELQMEFQTSAVSICNSNKQYLIGTSFFTRIFAYKFVMFPLLLVTV